MEILQWLGSSKKIEKTKGTKKMRTENKEKLLVLVCFLVALLADSITETTAKLIEELIKLWSLLP